jgi:hypothetical protein
MPRCFLEVAKAFRALAVINVLSAVAGMSVVTVVLYTAPPAWALAGALLSETMVLAACWIVVRSISITKSADVNAPTKSRAIGSFVQPEYKIDFDE